MPRLHQLLATLLALLLACASPLFAQFGSNSGDVGNIRVYVEFEDAHPAGLQFRVRLMNGASSTQIAEAFTSDRGTVEFSRVPIGEYHVLVTGEGIKEADSGEFEVDRRKATQSVFVTVHRMANSDAPQGLSSVSASELGIPEKARKEADRAGKAMGAQDWSRAMQHWQRAIELYPDYAAAYNGLGVVYGRLDQVDLEKEAFRRAIAADTRFAAPYVNLAKLNLREQHAPEAETLLQKATEAEPNNPETMTLLAQAELLNAHFDAAIKTAHDVHALQHPNLAVVHYIAARAMERSSRPQDAVAELQVFLTEEPSGSRADRVREELAQLQGQKR